MTGQTTVSVATGRHRGCHDRDAFVRWPGPLVRPFGSTGRYLWVMVRSGTTIAGPPPQRTTFLDKGKPVVKRGREAADQESA